MSKLTFALFALAVFALPAFAGDRIEMVSPSTGTTWRTFPNTTTTPTIVGRYNFLLSAPSTGSATVTTAVSIKVETCAGGACKPIKLGSSGILKAYISGPTGAQVSPEIVLPFAISTTAPYRTTQEFPLTVTVHGQLSTAGTYSLAVALLSSGSPSDSPFQYKLQYATVHVVNE